MATQNEEFLQRLIDAILKVAEAIGTASQPAPGTSPPVSAGSPLPQEPQEPQIKDRRSILPSVSDLAATAGVVGVGMAGNLATGGILGAMRREAEQAAFDPLMYTSTRPLQQLREYASNLALAGEPVTYGKLKAYHDRAVAIGAREVSAVSQAMEIGGTGAAGKAIEFRERGFGVYDWIVNKARKMNADDQKFYAWQNQKMHED